MSLKSRILERIHEAGPMGIAEYMTLCLLDPVDGYYPTRDPLGADGDFITAPEISQMFGEVLGLWVLQSWRDMGSPPGVKLVELGPGRGVMMGDMLRSLRLDPGFLQSASVHLVEASPALQAVQGETLRMSPCPVLWHDRLGDVPQGPVIVVGNEYLDCLPIRQFIRQGGAWWERVVTISEDGLAFAQSTAKSSDDLGDAPNGTLTETRPATAQLVEHLAERFRAHSGRALFIDYGPAESAFGDTLQALVSHVKVDPLDEPGEADLTARVDFEVFAREADRAGLTVHGPVTQAALLSRLGLEIRATALVRGNPDAQAVIGRQVKRLTSGNEMGTLFKAISLSAMHLPAPLGFT